MGVNDTLHDGTTDFESLVGFRLDSKGKKIRKQSGWLKLFLALEDSNTCDHWKENYRVAKRKDGDFLYLIENKKVRSMEKTERKRKEKLEKEAYDRLYSKWDKEWELEKIKQEKIWNETHDEDGNLIENEDEDDNDNDDENKDEEEDDDDDKLRKRKYRKDI